MRSMIRLSSCVAFLLAFSLPLAAQTGESLIGDLTKDVADVEKKIVDLAKALPASAYDWRPGPGVRSTGEVLAHLASDNYFLPAAMGFTPPAATGISGKDYKTTLAFEKKTRTRDEIIAEVEKSFAFLKQSMAGVTDAKMGATMEVFGQKTTGRNLWISTVTHVHEHLGQLIAYARVNKVTPPWSK